MHEKVWSVRVDVHVLDHDGGLMDAILLATIAGLLHFRRPYASVDGEAVIIHSSTEHEPVPLTVSHRPFAVTLAIFRQGYMYFYCMIRILYIIQLTVIILNSC